MVTTFTQLYAMVASVSQGSVALKGWKPLFPHLGNNDNVLFSLGHGDSVRESMLNTGCIVRFSGYKDPRSSKRINPENQWPLGGAGLAEDSEVVLGPQKHLGRQWGLAVRDTLEGTSQRVACSRDLQILLIFKESDVSCFFRGTAVGCGTIKWGPQLATRLGRHPLSQTPMWLVWPVGITPPPAPVPVRKILFVYGSGLKSILCPPWWDKWKFQQVAMCTRSWDPGSLCEGAFTWPKSFTY